MKKITSYNIIASTNYSDLVTQVNDRINEGWQPYGNLSATSYQVTDGVELKIKTNFFQAIVLYYEGPEGETQRFV